MPRMPLLRAHSANTYAEMWGDVSASPPPPLAVLSFFFPQACAKLLELKADPSVKAPDGRTVLSCAAASGLTEVSLSLSLSF